MFASPLFLSLSLMLTSSLASLALPLNIMILEGPISSYKIPSPSTQESRLSGPNLPLQPHFSLSLFLGGSMTYFKEQACRGREI